MNQIPTAQFDSDTEPTSRRAAHELRLARVCLAVVVLYAGLMGVDRAARRPFWFDEILTIAVSTQPTASELWKALGSGLDHNPPLFHAVEHVAAALPFDRHVTFRLPSILAFCLTTIALFLFVTRATGQPLAGATAAVLTVATQLFVVYAVEARPYALVACLIAWAIVLWQRADRGVRFSVASGLCLMAATSMHYYAVLGVIPLAAAEFVRWLRTREIRLMVWLALAATVVPIAVFWPLMSHIRAEFATHFWARPPIVGFLRTYDAFLYTSNWWGVAVSGAVGLALGVSLLRTFRSERRTWPASMEPDALILMSLALPPFIFAAAHTLGVGVTARYLIPTALGMIAGIAVVARSRGVTAMVATIAVCAVVTRGLEDQYARTPTAERVMTRELASLSQLVADSSYRDLPVSVTNGLSFLPLAFYDHPRALKLMYVTDAHAAVAFAGTDTTELLLQHAAPLLQLDVQSLDEVTRSLDRFLLYGGNEMWDWLPSQLKQRGYRLQFLARSGSSSLFLAERVAGSGQL